IRDRTVTGVQTCALPILLRVRLVAGLRLLLDGLAQVLEGALQLGLLLVDSLAGVVQLLPVWRGREATEGVPYRPVWPHRYAAFRSEGRRVGRVRWGRGWG